LDIYGLLLGRFAVVQFGEVVSFGVGGDVGGGGVFVMMQETVWKNGVESIKCLGGMCVTRRLRVHSWNGGPKMGKASLESQR